MRLQRLPEIVGTERRVSEVIKQRIPGHRTGDGERPTAERAATMSWYDEMVAARRSKSLTTGNVRCGVAGVHEVLEEPCLGDTGELSIRAYGGFAGKHRASAARSGADVSSLGRTSQYY